MSAFHDIEGKVEDAYATAITSNVTALQLNGATVLTAIAGAAITSGTRVVCECARTRGVKGLPGTYLATATVRVHSKASTSDKTTLLTEHRARTGYVRDLLMDTTFGETLTSSEADFTVNGIISEIQTEWREDVDHLIAEMTQEIHCAVAD